MHWQCKLKSLQLYNGDSTAREVSKKRGYSAPYDYMKEAAGHPQNRLLDYKESDRVYEPSIFNKPVDAYETRQPVSEK